MGVWGRDNSVRSRSASILVAVVAIAGWIASPAPAGAEPGSGLVCSHSGRVKPKPGLTTDSKTVKFSFRGTLSDCHMHDGSVLSGVEYGSGVATGSCMTRTATGTWTIRWSNGRQTVMRAEFNGAVNVISTSGEVTKGLFTGWVMQDGHMLGGFDPTACMSASGVTDATYQGVLALASR